jgi:hypothetical protein
MQRTLESLQDKLIKSFEILDFKSVVVPKPLTLYTHECGMGKKNKVVKLTERKIRYLCEASLDALDENQDALNIKKFGLKKKTLDEESVEHVL